MEANLEESAVSWLNYALFEQVCRIEEWFENCKQCFENIKSEYEKSLLRLLPFKEKLRKTDWFIDQIVYKLYRLTEDEIKAVEKATKE